MNDYYIYLHIKETTGEPFYLGKGRRYRDIQKHGRSGIWNNTVSKYGLDILKLEEGLTEQEVFEREKYWIKRIGRRDLGMGPLVNFTDGGEGASNISEELRNKKSKSMIGKPSNRKGKFGNKLSDETKTKIANSRKRKIICNVTGIVYDSIQEAAKETGINKNTLSSYLRGLANNKTNLTYL